MTKDLYQVKVLISTVDGGQYPCLSSSLCFDSPEEGLAEAKSRVSEIQGSLSAALSSQLVAVGQYGKQMPLGVTMEEVLKHFGVVGFSVGVVKTKAETSNIVAPKSGLVVLK